MGFGQWGAGTGSLSRCRQCGKGWMLQGTQGREDTRLAATTAEGFSSNEQYGAVGELESGNAGPWCRDGGRREVGSRMLPSKT